MTAIGEFEACDSLEEALLAFKEGLSQIGGHEATLRLLEDGAGEMLGWHYPRLRAPTIEQVERLFCPDYKLIYSAGGVTLDRYGYREAVEKMASNGVDCDVRMVPLVVGCDIVLIDDTHRWTLRSGAQYTSRRWTVTRFRNGQRLSTDVIVRDDDDFADWHAKHAADFGHG